jgi:RNA polymerase sigma factor (sigma-70 family)
MPSPSSDSIPQGVHQFASTHWSVVIAARGDTTDARTALATLCEAYWYPLYAFVRRQGHSPHDAQDLTQEFFFRLLAKGWLISVDRQNGKFRSWLLASMNHFLANEWDRAKAIKRGGQATFVPFDADSAEMRYRHEPTDPSTPERLFDRRWALTLLDRVLDRLCDEMTEAGKLAQFQALKGTLAGEKTPYAAVAVALHSTEGAVKVAVHRLRERYRELLRNEIAQTVANPEEVDEELRHLFAVLSRNSAPLT